MAADARTLYNALTAAAVDASPKLHPDAEWPLLVLVAHGDTVSTLAPPHPTNSMELGMILGGWIPTAIAAMPTRPHAAALQWPAPDADGHGAVHVLSIEHTVGWQAHALINRRAVARLHPILAPFPEPTKIDNPATAETAGHFAHRCLLFSLGLAI
jgi:hypothetical protein